MALEAIRVRMRASRRVLTAVPSTRATSFNFNSGADAFPLQPPLYLIFNSMTADRDNNDEKQGCKKKKKTNKKTYLKVFSS